MRRMILLLTLALISVNASATIDPDPDFSFLWSGFSSIEIVDDYAVAATNEGLVVLAYDSTQKTYQPLSHLFLETEPIEQKLSGDVLAVRSASNIIYFIDLSTLPELSLLGEADLGHPFEDYASFGQDLYVANGFKGLWRYTMVNYSSLRLADSSTIGIHYTKVDIQGDMLYALDDYNGILRYQLFGIGFGQFKEYLYLPKRATSFTTIDKTIAVALETKQLMTGHFDPSPPALTQTYDLFITPEQLRGMDTILVALNSKSFYAEVVYLSSGEQFQFPLAEQPDSGFGGRTLTWAGESHLIFPTKSGGLDLYNLDQIQFDPTPVPFFGRPGPITDLAIHRSRLYTGGLNNPLDFYRLLPDGTPTDRGTLYSGFNSISHIHQSGEFLAIMYPSFRHVVVMNLFQQPMTLHKSVYVGEGVEGILFNPKKIDTLRSLYTFSNNKVYAYTISDPQCDDCQPEVHPAFDIGVIDRVYDIEVIDSLLFISSGKNKIEMYQIFSDFDVDHLGSIGLSDITTNLNRHEGRLIAINNREVVVIDPAKIGIGSPEVARVEFSINSSYVDGNLLAVVGDEGFSILDLSVSPPRVLDYGGRGGDQIAIGDSIVAISNGHVIHIFDMHDIATAVEDSPGNLPRQFTLAQNYPNPFNPSTTIDFELGLRTNVTLEIFNMLGQSVNTLIDGELPAGNHRVIWLGTNAQGKRVASGLYLYRLRTDGLTATKKMVLLK